MAAAQVGLLHGGASSRVTEIAAKSLANLGSAPTNKTGIRLAGGIPPLVALLMEQPSPQACALPPPSSPSSPPPPPSRPHTPHTHTRKHTHTHVRTRSSSSCLGV